MKIFLLIVIVLVIVTKISLDGKMIFCRHRCILGEIAQNKGYYAIEGHSRSVMSVPIECPYATSY